MLVWNSAGICLSLGMHSSKTMRKLIFNALFLGGILIFADLSLTSCTSRNHCPAVAGTGNSASRKAGFGRGGSCPAVKGTGTSKPKIRRKPQVGLTSKKMDKAMAKAKKKDAKPIQKRTLSADQ